MAAKIFTKAHDIGGQLCLLDLDQGQFTAAVRLADYSGKVDPKDGEVQANLFPEFGGLEFKAFYFLIKDLGEDELGDTHIAHQEFENNVVYGVGYSHGHFFMSMG